MLGEKGAGKMAQWEKAFVTKLVDLSLISVSNTVERQIRLM